MTRQINKLHIVIGQAGVKNSPKRGAAEECLIQRDEEKETASASDMPSNRVTH